MNINCTAGSYRILSYRFSGFNNYHSLCGELQMPHELKEFLTYPKAAHTVINDYSEVNAGEISTGDFNDKKIFTLRTEETITLNTPELLNLAERACLVK